MLTPPIIDLYKLIEILQAIYDLNVYSIVNVNINHNRKLSNRRTCPCFLFIL